MSGFVEIEWDKHNFTKNEETHGVTAWEIEEALLNPHYLAKGKSHPTERRLYLYGRTEEGRYLFIVLQDKGHGIARPISARDMSDKERRRYASKGKKA